jgi:polar amino acid transport system substrate-binding protein
MKRFKWLVLAGLILVSMAILSCSQKATTTIRVATDASGPPFESVNQQTKQIEGFDIDLLNAIAGKENLKIEYVNVAFDSLLAGVAQGQYDAAISSISITEVRQKEMLFSDPYFTTGQIVAVSKDNIFISGKDSLSGRKVGAQIDTTGATDVGNISGAILKTYDNIDSAFQDLINGQLDAVVADNPLVLSYVDKNPTKLKTAGPVFSVDNYGIAVSKGKTGLLNEINDGLKKVEAEGLIDSLSKKWLGK